jgi:hypothetical protein
MSDKASQAGWVVEVTRPAAGSEPSQTTYFDVAIRTAAEAVAVATRKSGIVGATGRTVRPLSYDEIEFIGLKVGEVRPS